MQSLIPPEFQVEYFTIDLVYLGTRGPRVHCEQLTCVFFYSFDLFSCFSQCYFTNWKKLAVLGHPCKHKTPMLCWPHVGPASQTVAQRDANTGSKTAPISHITCSGIF